MHLRTFQIATLKIMDLCSLSSDEVCGFPVQLVKASLPFSAAVFLTNEFYCLCAV